MSTRCHVIVTKNNPNKYLIGGAKGYVYRHHDGYPSTTGEDLRNFISKNKEKIKNWSVEDFCNNLSKHNDQYEYENYGVHGDEEYIYFVNLDTNKFECYSILNYIASEDVSNDVRIFNENF